MIGARARRVLSAARSEAFRACRRRGRFDVDDVLDFVVGALALDTVERSEGTGDGCGVAYEKSERGRSGELSVTMRDHDRTIVSLLTTFDLARHGHAVAGSEHGARALELAARERARERVAEVNR